MSFEKLKSASKPIRSSSVPSSPIHSPNSYQLLERPTASTSTPSGAKRNKKRHHRSKTGSQPWPDMDQRVPTCSNNNNSNNNKSSKRAAAPTSPLQHGQVPQDDTAAATQTAFGYEPPTSPLTLPPCSPPISPDPHSPSTSTTFIQHMPSMSFWDYLRDELTVSDFDSTQEIKRERITNFLAVPGSLEKLMGFGFVVCLDSFLYTFTILPLRFALALYQYIYSIYINLQVLWYGHGAFLRLRPSQKCDLLKGLLITITCMAMVTLDPSRFYHAIRGQAVLKLYVIFNVLEICDKLCCSVGVDILDALFSKSTLGSTTQGSTSATDYAKRHLKPLTLFFLAAIYMLIHTAVLFFEMITLNVAINFYSNALLSLLISNQFVEIKQAVFKKFERENLFQLSCSDIVERFQQSVFLTIITLRNVVELADSSPSSVLPSTFVPLFQLPTSISLNNLMTPVLMVIASELIVDWLKHAFITKFNQIRPSIYDKYIDILCRDLVVGNPGRLSSTNKKKNAFIDQSPVVSRRIGFPALPLACMAIRMMQQLLPMIFTSGQFDDGASGNGSSSGTTVASALTNGLLGYLTDHQGIFSRLLPARIQLVILSLVQCGWLEQGLDKLVRTITWVLVIALSAIVLLALKVLVGMTLLGFAYKRYETMEERETQEQQKDKAMQEMNKPEQEYQKRLQTYLSDPADNVMGRAPIKYTLDNVDRFSMVRSRIP